MITGTRAVQAPVGSRSASVRAFLRRTPSVGAIVATLPQAVHEWFPHGTTLELEVVTDPETRVPYKTLVAIVRVPGDILEQNARMREFRRWLAIPFERNVVVRLGSAVTAGVD